MTQAVPSKSTPGCPPASNPNRYDTHIQVITHSADPSECVRSHTVGPRPSKLLTENLRITEDNTYSKRIHPNLSQH